VEKLLEQLVTDTEASAVNYATSAFIYPPQTTPDGFTWTGTVNASALLAGYFQQDSPSVQDFLSFRLPLAAGDYILAVTHLNASAGGILTAYHNGDSLGTMDTYHSTTQLNQGSEFSFTVDNDELATFALRVTSKNASSSNYYMLIQYIIIRPDV
jgi:opacity protein-like surface antigen